jgi:hypothetical protein
MPAVIAEQYEKVMITTGGPTVSHKGYTLVTGYTPAKISDRR